MEPLTRNRFDHNSHSRQHLKQTWSVTGFIIPLFVMCQTVKQVSCCDVGGMVKLVTRYRYNPSTIPTASDTSPAGRAHVDMSPRLLVLTA